MKKVYNYQPFFEETENWRDYEDEGEELDPQSFNVGDKFKYTAEKKTFEIIAKFSNINQENFYSIKIFINGKFKKDVQYTSETAINTLINAGMLQQI